MNSDLTTKWNKTVSSDDTVYYLGDFAKGKNPNRWKRKLKGQIVFIRGNHDRRLHGTKRGMKLYYEGYKFWLSHYPNHKPKDWDGWIIHGHTHNKSKKYPFINGDLRTINVSCELIDYCPVDLDSIISLDLESIKRMETIHSEPVRKNRESHPPQLKRFDWKEIEEPPSWVKKAAKKQWVSGKKHPYNQTRHFTGRHYVYKVYYQSMGNRTVKWKFFKKERHIGFENKHQ